MDVVSGMESVVQWTQAIQSTCEGSGNAGALGDVMQLVMAFKEDCNSGIITRIYIIILLKCYFPFQRSRDISSGAVGRFVYRGEVTGTM